MSYRPPIDDILFTLTEIAVAPAGEIAVSAVTGAGLDDLRQSVVARLLALGVPVPLLGAPPA